MLIIGHIFSSPFSSFALQASLLPVIFRLHKKSDDPKVDAKGNDHHEARLDESTQPHKAAEMKQ